ncbi:MAG: tetratricopeptide repeat protein [Deltaproteobacteria bacterium]|nr:tetratricopeptide repeat protein [Deltaproteobacteria bacterium]
MSSQVPPGGLDIGHLLAEVPELMAGARTDGFKLDATSTRILELVDGSRNLGEIAAIVQADPRQVVQTLELLARAHVVHLPWFRPTRPSAAMPAVTAYRDGRPSLRPEPKPAAGRVTAPAPAPETGTHMPGPTQSHRPSMIFTGPETSPAPLADGLRGTGSEAPRPPSTSMLPPGPFSASSSGNLKDAPAAAVVDKARITGLTGSVAFSRQGKKITVYFEQGQPVAAEGSAPEHEFGAMLRTSGRIDEILYAAYKQALEAGSPNAIVALRYAGVQDRKTMAGHASWHGRSLIEEAYGWRDGSYTVTPGDPVPPRLPKVSLAAPTGVSANWRKSSLTEEQEAFLEKMGPYYMVATPAALQLVATMGLDPKEAHWVKNVLEKPIQVRRAQTISTLFRTVTRKILSALVTSTVVKLVETNPDGVTPVPLEELAPFASRIEVDNHFNVITAHPVSTLEEIKTRYRNRLAEFDPSLYPQADDVHKDALKRIRQRFDKAWEVLSDEQTRREYRNSMYGQDQLESFVDLQLRKAEVALHLRQNPDVALPLAESAMDVLPENAHAHIVLAGCLHRLGRVKEARAHLAAVRAVPPSLKKQYDAIKADLE